jgi:hypothetical protein
VSELTLCHGGKPTTLAAMVDLVYRSMHEHAVTIEDPTGFLHRDGRVLRQDPDEGSLRSGGPRVSKFLSPESFVFRR